MQPICAYCFLIFSLLYSHVSRLHPHSGATEHMISQREVLDNVVNKSNEAHVTVANGEDTPIKGTGDVLLKGGIKIKGVLFGPNFKYNLLSVRRLTRDLHCEITFFPNFFVI